MPKQAVLAPRVFVPCALVPSLFRFSPRLRVSVVDLRSSIRLSLVKASTLPYNSGHFLPQHHLDYSVRQVL